MKIVDAVREPKGQPNAEPLVGVQVGRVPVPGYEVQNVLDINDLGTHQYNKGTVALEPRGGDLLIARPGQIADHFIASGAGTAAAE